MRVFQVKGTIIGQKQHVFEGGTPLNTSPIEIHAFRPFFKTVFLPHVTMMEVFISHECIRYVLNFILNLIFLDPSR